MHKEDNVYDYIINSINNIITNGISYYADKDIDKINRLMDIYDYINDYEEPIIDINHGLNTIEDINIDPTEGDIIISDESKGEIKALIDDFMSKMTDIKIAVLNLENDLSLYYNNLSDDIINNRESLVTSSTEIVLDEPDEIDDVEESIQSQGELLSVNTVKVNDLSDDELALEVTEDKSYDNGDFVVDNDSPSEHNQENDILVGEHVDIDNKEDDELPSAEVSQTINDEETIDDGVEVDNKPKKHSILDLFRKKNG